MEHLHLLCNVNCYLDQLVRAVWIEFSVQCNLSAIPSSALPGSVLVSQSDAEAQAGTSTELTDSGETNSSSTPLAQHPSKLLTGGNEPHLRKPLGRSFIAYKCTS